MPNTDQEDFDQDFESFVNGNKGEQQENTSESDVNSSEQQQQEQEAGQSQSTEQNTNNEASNNQQSTSQNIDKLLEESSGGLFKNLDDLKTALPKFQGYDNLQQERDNLQKTTQTNPFANDYLRILNDLVKSGAPDHQIKAFEEINKAGDLSSLDPFKVMLNKLVIIDKYTPEVAERIIKKDFPIVTDEDELEAMSEDERLDNEVLKQRLAKASAPDLQELSKYKAQVSDPVASQTEQSLKSEAAKIQRLETIRPMAAEIASRLTGLGKINLNGGEGDKAIMSDVNFTPEYQSEIPAMVEKYLSLEEGEITKATVGEAMKYVIDNYKVLNYERDIQKAHKDAWANATEAMVKKYENKGGFDTNHQTFESNEAADRYNAQLEKIASGED